MKSRGEIEEELVLAITSALTAEVQEAGVASLLVSGGSTPINMFQLLSKSEISWDKVTVSLVDERLVSKDHKDLNENLVRNNLLQNLAKNAQFVPLVIGERNSILNLEGVKKITGEKDRPFTAVVLGMGGDGHTASLFPESPQLAEGMDLESIESLILTEPITAPYQRVSFTRKALLNTKNLFLHCYGNEKKEVLDQAKKQKGLTPYPIAGFLNQEITKLKVYWTN